jgi:hypothetical protein
LILNGEAFHKGIGFTAYNKEMRKLYLKLVLMLFAVGILNGCSIISTVDTAVDVALLPVKVGVAVVDAVIPDGDD